MSIVKPDPNGFDPNVFMEADFFALGHGWKKADRKGNKGQSDMSFPVSALWHDFILKKFYL